VHVHGDDEQLGDDDKVDVARGGGPVPVVLPAVRAAAAASCGLEATWMLVAVVTAVAAPRWRRRDRCRSEIARVVARRR